MNKSELISEVSKLAGLPKVTINQALDATLKVVANALKRSDKVTLVGFGTFYTSNRAARMGRNPQTNKAMKIKAAKVPRFRAGKNLKDTVE